MSNRQRTACVFSQNLKKNQKKKKKKKTEPKDMQNVSFGKKKGGIRPKEQ